MDKIDDIIDAKRDLDKRYKLFIDGAITALELETTVINLIVATHTFQLNEMFNPDGDS